MTPSLRQVAAALAKIEIWPVALFVAGSIATERLLLPALGIISAFWIIRRIALHHWTIRTSGDFPIIVLLIIIPINYWVSPFPQTTLLQLYRLLTGIGFYYALANWCRTEARQRLLLQGLGLAGVGLAFVGLLSVQSFISKLPFIPIRLYQEIPRVFSDAIHPNVLAGYLILLLPITIALLLFARAELKTQEIVIFVVSTLAMTLTLILTQSRGGLLGLVVALALLPVLRWRKGWLLTLTAVMVFLTTVEIIGIPRFLELLNTSNSAINSAQGRLEAWSRALDMIKDFPITGIGMGMYGPVADHLYPFWLSAPGSVPHAHNLILQIAVDLGLPGLAAWLSVFVLITVATWRCFRWAQASQQAWLSGICAGFLCSQTALLVHGQLDAVTWGMVRPAPLVWAIWGLALATSLGHQSGALIQPEIVPSPIVPDY